MTRPTDTDHYRLLEKYQDAQNEIRWLQRAHADTATELQQLRQSILDLDAQIAQSQGNLWSKAFVQGMVRSLLPVMYWGPKKKGGLK